ncbi:hypothetical protein QTJ16_004209 [Diplocarpon rosae]|uniref:Uncharacterized protein n=1 Tax=Diplocarpon rosae TaxID=946125 RepID=A0AAD9WFH1_9HELO|nr:hypothetical protein QTJ16_004209 [Diplocarpon rosae]
MWKRLQHPRIVRQPSYDEPVLAYQESMLEKSYGGAGDHLGLIAEQGQRLEQHQHQHQQYGYGSKYEERPRREDVGLKGLPRLPFEASPPQAHLQDHRRDSIFRPASSIYSQPSPNPTSVRFPQHSYHTPEYVEEELPPVSSPESGPVRNRSEAFNDAEDSSINKMPDISQLGLNQASPSSKPPRSIPVMRREKRAQVAAAAANLSSRKQAGDAPRGRVAHDPRWDPYSGEITTSDKGKPQSVKPGTFSPPGLRPLHLGTGLQLGNESSITGGRSPKTHTSLGDHVRRLQSTNSSGKERPEWKGATGRTTLVSPVQDQHHKPPISMPRKNNLLNSTREGTPGTIVRTSSAETSPDPRTRTSTSPVNPTPDLVGAPQSAATKTVARNAGEDRPGDQGMERDEGTMAQIEHTFERGVREALPDVSEEKENKDEDEHEYQQPSSRFSVTTYTPSEAATPRLSNETFESQAPKPDLTPILNRTRPRYVESPEQNQAQGSCRDPDSGSQRPSSIRSLARKAVLCHRAHPPSPTSTLVPARAKPSPPPPSSTQASATTRSPRCKPRSLRSSTAARTSCGASGR